MSTATPPASYRPDIDGLRAVAIVPVVLYHAFPAAFPGGYVGVDVFFVISGFLISGIIFKAAERGTFSFADFYARRIRRIFPALATALTACMAAGWWLLLPNEFAHLGKHVAAGAAFVSNLALWREAGYFDTIAEQKPLLHLWSLGIEEQFYIVWPVLVVLAWRRAHAFLLLVGLLLAGSFAINLWWIDPRPSAAFYLPVARFWELMIGSLLALATLRLRGWRERLAGHAAAWVLTLAGAGLIAAAWALLTKTSAFPGWWALLPTIGTALVIGFGERTWLGARVLSSRPMVYVGQISYPLYLWHWPVLVMGRLAGVLESGWAVGGAVALSLGLAAATHRWVEAPFRAGQGGRGRTVALAVGMVAVALAGLVLLAGLPPRTASPEIARVVAAADEWDYPGRLEASWVGDLRIRQQGKAGAATVLFVGDSNVEQYYPRAERLLEASRTVGRIAFATRGGCPPIPHVVGEAHLGCGSFVEEVKDYARRPEVGVVVVGAQWFAYLAGKGQYHLDQGGRQSLQPGGAGYRQALEGLRALLAGWVAAGKRVYLVRNIPVSPRLDPRRMVDRSLLRDPYVTLDLRGADRAELMTGLQAVYDDLGAVAAAAGATVVSPMDSLCSETRCPSVTPDGEPMYKDASHLRPRFVREHVRFLDGAFD